MKKFLIVNMQIFVIMFLGIPSYAAIQDEKAGEETLNIIAQERVKARLEYNRYIQNKNIAAEKDKAGAIHNRPEVKNEILKKTEKQLAAGIIFILVAGLLALFVKRKSVKPQK